MANELYARGNSGDTLYAVLSDATERVYSTVAATFGTYATGSLADYDIALTEQGTASGRYAGNMPAVAAGIYRYDVYVRAGGSPAETDTKIWHGWIDWDSTAVVSISNLDSDLVTIAANVAAILADTGADGVAISATTANQLADALLKRDMSAVTGEAARSVLNAMRLLRNKVSESGGTLTVTKEDDSTSAWTATVTTNAAAEPITAIDPA